MRHPDLPADQVIETDEATVPHYASAGWVVTDPPPAPVSETDPSDAPESSGALASDTPETTRRRRAQKEGDEK